MFLQEIEPLKKEGVKQKRFVLTRDFVKINFSGHNFQNCSFICPLPKGYNWTVAEKLKDLKETHQMMKDQINEKAEKEESPFENILMGHNDKNPEEQRELLKEFKISCLGIDDRGIYNIQAGNDKNRANTHLNKDCYELYNLKLCDALMNIFEPKTAFCCESATFWQALLISELCIKYFNWLNENIPPRLNF